MDEHRALGAHFRMNIEKMYKEISSLIEQRDELRARVSELEARVSNLHGRMISFRFRGRAILEYALATQDSSIIDIELADSEHRKDLENKLYPLECDHAFNEIK